jgi:hypothetical protein
LDRISNNLVRYKLFIALARELPFHFDPRGVAVFAVVFNDRGQHGLVDIFYFTGVNLPRTPPISELMKAFKERTGSFAGG